MLRIEPGNGGLRISAVVVFKSPVPHGGIGKSPALQVLYGVKVSALLFGGFTLDPLRSLAVALCRVAVKPEKRLALREVGFFGLAAFPAVQQTVLACVVAAVRLGIRQQIDSLDFAHKLSPSLHE